MGMQPRVVYLEYGGRGAWRSSPHVSHFLLLFSLRILPCWTQTEEPGAAAWGIGAGGTRESRYPARPLCQAASFPAQGREQEPGCEQQWESESREPEPEPGGPRPGPQPSPAQPVRPRVLPPSQPGPAGLVGRNTAPSSPRRGGKTPWCSRKQLGQQLPQNFARASRGGRGG